jgi:hypothetical protein
VYPARVTTGNIRLDDRHWPLVVVVYEGSPDTATFERYLAEMDRCLSRKERHGYLLDGRDGAMLGGEQRTAQGLWLKSRKDELRRFSMGTSLVIRQASIRFLVSAIYLIQRPVAPTETFSTLEEAHRWLETVFAKEQMKIPPLAKLEL